VRNVGSSTLFGQAGQFAGCGAEGDLNGLFSELSRGVIAIAAEREDPYGANLTKPATGLQVNVNALQIEHLRFCAEIVGATGMPGLRKGLERRLIIQCAGWIFLVEKEHPCL